MTITEIREILECRYDRKIWKNFLQQQFTNNKLNADDRTIQLSDKTLTSQCISLGNYEINEYTNIGIFEVQLQEKVNISRNRVALRNTIKEITKQVAGAMVVFVQGDKWRFSYISKRKVKNGANQVEDRQTAPKRYTYLFGKNEKALTAAIRFDRLIQKQKENIFQFLSLDDFEEAFSVEKLSKEFFKNYKEIYEDFVQFLTGKRYGKKGNKYVEQVIHEPDWQLTALFGKDEKAARDFCKRMMGRIVFLYFIQKKGWLSVAKGKNWGEGNPDYLYHLFTNSKYQDDFYAKELVPLFFTRLNNEDSENKARDERFPYLNGGLFDDSLDRKYNKLHLPEDVFKRLFETFNNYNFTVYEDAPDEHTVAVDPEMLGHIFENLLEDNKDKGAYYTPKEIVHYMCRESLKAYLLSNEDLKASNEVLAEQAITNIINQAELTDEEKSFAEKHAYKIIDALDHVKICDPAIGSGAFPMGLLQEIFNAQIYLQELKGFKKRVTDADIKKHIIEESIYGVDIDAGAVDIARLRFWLSLVVDEQEPQPLPNLDFKIVCANTLIPLGKLTGNDMEAKASLAVKELEKIRHEFFSVSRENKLRLERQFRKVQTDLLSLRELASDANFEIYTKLYEFNPFEGKSCSWFDPWWMFGIKHGFDIVIGNPPYVEFKNLEKAIKNELEKVFVSASGKYDLYIPFLEMPYRILKDDGVLVYICPTRFMHRDYGQGIRRFINENYQLNKIVDFGDSQMFENAMTYTGIFVLNKMKRSSKFLYKKFNEQDNVESFDAIRFTQISNDLDNEPWYFDNFENTLLPILKQYSQTLEEVTNGIIQGIATGKDSVFIVDEAVVNQENLERDCLQKILKGKDIHPWQINWNNQFVIYPYDSQGKVIEEGVLRNKYPNIYSYLVDRKDELKGRTYFDKSNKKWYELWNQRSLEKFTTDKIITLDNASKNSFTFDDSSFVGTTTVYSIIPKYDIDIKFLLALLNSKALEYYHKKNTIPQAGGFYRYQALFIKGLPIKKPIAEIQFLFRQIADYILFLKRPRSKNIITHTDNIRIAAHIEEVLNMMVYELYFEEHMKEVGLDVLQSVKFKLNAKTTTAIEKQIVDFYLWLQTPDNPVRQRINLVDIKSPDILSRINLATQ